MEGRSYHTRVRGLPKSGLLTSLGENARQRMMQESRTEASFDTNRRGHFAALALVLLLAFASYARTLWFGFVFDDHAHVLDNWLIESWDHVGNFFRVELILDVYQDPAIRRNQYSRCSAGSARVIRVRAPSPINCR